MTVNFGGNVYDDAGNAVSGASVKLLETGTTTQEGSTVTTDSAGRWDFGEADQDRYDVEITKGSSVRRIKWSDEISLQEIDVRNNTGATTPAATFTNLTNNVANQVAVFSGANSTKADGDEIYLSFKLHDSAGNLDEFARMTVEATDVTTTTEDGQIRFGVIVGGTLTDVFTIDSSTGGAATISYEVDSFTIKGGEGEAGVLYLFADQGDDAGDEWKVNVADGGVLTIGNDIASAGTYVTFLTLTPHATTASSTVAIVGDATVGDDLSLTSDSSVFNMGAGNDFTITHDGTTGATLAGSPITVNSTGALTLDSSTDITLDADGADVFLKDGGTLFGTLTNSSGELVIKSSSSGTTAATFSGANVTLAGTVGSGAITSSGIIKTDDATEATSTTDGSLQTDGGLSVVKDAVFGDDIFLLSDSAVFNMGAGNDFTITHDGTTGATLAGNPITITAAGASTWSTSSGALTITSAAALNLNPASGSAILLDGTISVDAGVVTGVTAITSATIDATTDFTIGSTVITDDSIVMTPSSSDTVTIAAATNGALSITTVDNAAAAANVQITADGTAELAGTTVTLDAGGDIDLAAAADVNIPSGIGLTFGDDGEKIEGDGTDLSIASSGYIRIDADAIGFDRAPNADRYFFIQKDFGESDANKYGIHVRPVASERDGASEKHLVGLYAQPYIGGSSFDATNNQAWTLGVGEDDNVGVRCIMTEAVVDAAASGAIEGVAGLYIKNGDISGSASATFTNQYGIYMESLTEGGTNVGIDMHHNSLIRGGPITVGVDDTGYDVKFFGATSGKYLQWDQSDDKLVVVGHMQMTGAHTLDLNAEATLVNVGAAGNDWTANTLQVSSANAGGSNLLYVENTNNSDTASHAIVKLEVGGSSGGDPKIWFLGTGYSMTMGMDNSESSRFALGVHADLGGADALRIVAGTKAITFEDSSGADFDYVCDTCHHHSDKPFICHGVDAPWHEDMPVLMARNTPTGLQQLVNLGVYEVDGPERDQPGWTGVNLQQATHFTWSAMAQMYDEFDRRLAAIGG